ncbi:MAG: hypothetical protein H6917_10665 [Novosphingobium sp.]|nr:hypothetical protein [Novosphingobium sp.]MCP5402834.1 hypothetical protein [Novosphingobium sp.]
MLRSIVILSATCLLAMVLIDRMLGPRAEFLNAWSVAERLLGRTPEAGDSFIARRFGALGELFAVLLVNTVLGTLLALLIRFVTRTIR